MWNFIFTVFADMVAVTPHAFVVAEIRAALLHHGSSCFCGGRFRAIRNLRLTVSVLMGTAAE